MVILFSDIRDFTPLAEALSPEATIQLINDYFSRMVEVLRRHDGIILDFLGDEILAFFDPLDGPLAPVVRGALRCALSMQQAMLGVTFAGIGHQLPPVHMGIGLHVGEVVVGNIGSEPRAKYGIVGSAVNLAHRIQAQAQGGEVVVSQSVYRLFHSEVKISRKFEVRLKGIQDPVTLYAVGSLLPLDFAGRWVAKPCCGYKFRGQRLFRSGIMALGSTRGAYRSGARADPWPQQGRQGRRAGQI